MYRTTILPLVLYGCETCSVTLREEHRLRAFANRVLRRVVGTERNKVSGEWRRLHREELYALYFSPNIIRAIKSRRMGWPGHVACLGDRRGTNRVLVGRPQEKRPLERPRHRWEANIKTDLQEVGLGGMDRLDLAVVMDRWRALVSAVMDLRVA
jgi:hypothetical protein